MPDVSNGQGQEPKAEVDVHLNASDDSGQDDLARAIADAERELSDSDFEDDQVPDDDVQSEKGAEEADDKAEEIDDVGKTEVEDLKAEVAELKARLSAAERKARKEIEEDDSVDLPSGWDELKTPLEKQAARTRAIREGQLELAQKQQQLQATVDLLMFKGEHPEWQKHEKEMTRILRSGTISWDHGYKAAMEAALEIAEGRAAKNEKASAVKRDNSQAIRRINPSRPVTREVVRGNQGTKLLTLAEAVELAHKQTARKLQARGRS